ncbi:MAG: hypothetical protein HY922_04505 [Elusimicrobia bacterium]|nr:hypothetical protein [Elusimicrobiota bacterium]
MVYLAVFEGKCSKLRNSLSRREFFRQGVDYYRAFNLRGETGAREPGPLPDGFEATTESNVRALQILVAREIEQVCREKIGKIDDKHARGSLRKGAYYLARIVYRRNKKKIDGIVQLGAPKPRTAKVARDLVKEGRKIALDSYGQAQAVFVKALKDYLRTAGGNEDSALKNTQFAEAVDAAAAPSSIAGAKS